MRYLTLLMLLWTTAVFAEHNGIPFDEKEIPVMCGDTEHLLEGLRERYGEEMIFIAVSKNAVGHDLSHSLWINYQTKTWTFIVVNKQAKTTCIHASGDNLNIFFPGNTT